jgi:hypothetical protein
LQVLAQALCGFGNFPERESGLIVRAVHAYYHFAKFLHAGIHRPHLAA